MANTIATSNRPNVFSLDFLKILLRGTGQVMFQNSVWTGIFFLVGIFWGAYWEGQGLVAWGALVGVAVSTMTGYFLKLPAKDGDQGLWGFNGVLVGCAFPTFMGSTVWMWLALILCSALTTWVRTGFNNVMAPWKVNSFTFPFVFCTWMFLLAARAMHGLPTTHMSDPALPGAFSAAENIGFGHLIVYWLKGIAQVFLINNWVTGILFLIGLYLSNRWAALWAAIGSALALFVALLFNASGYEIANGLYGFSAVLTAIALATVFYKPNARSAVWALLGILVTLFIQAGMNILLEPVGIATLTGPFCIATWLFLLPLIKFDDEDKPDHSNWDPENKKHLAEAQGGLNLKMDSKVNTQLVPVEGTKANSQSDLNTGANPRTGFAEDHSETASQPDDTKPGHTQQESRPNNTQQESRPRNTQQESRADNAQQESGPRNTQQKSRPNNTQRDSRPDNAQQESRPRNAQQESRADNAQRESRRDNTQRESRPRNAQQESRPNNTQQESRPDNAQQESGPRNTQQESRPHNAQQESRPGNARQNPKPDNK